MEKKLIEKFKKIFREERAALDLQESNLTSPAEEASVGDEGDQASAMSRQDLNRVMLARIKDRKQRLFVALNRINAGTFGTCEDCEEDIDVRRMETNPTATHCVDCQELNERTSKAYARGAE